jgi:hypothetical protein
MIKHLFVFQPAVSMVEADRYYFRFHANEVVRFVGPWLCRYETYRASNAPKEADRFGCLRGRLSELWYRSVGEFREADPENRPYTAPGTPGGWADLLGKAAVIIVPARPTEDFLGKEPLPEQVPILRWLRILKYPEGVSVKDGEKWYLETFSQDAKRQQGLLKYVSHRVLDDLPIQTPWCRVEEMWYQDFDAWRRAVVESPPGYTAPPWGKEEPFVDMVSTFVGYKPDVDFIKDCPRIP